MGIKLTTVLLLSKDARWYNNFVTDKIIFKLLNRSDYETYLSWQYVYSESSFFTLTAVGGFNTIDLLIREKDNSVKTFGIIANESLIGYIKFTQFNNDQGNMYLYLLLPLEYKSYLSYIKPFIIRFCQDHSTHKLQANVLEVDSELQANLVDIGFVTEGTMREQWFTHGKWLDIIIWGLFIEKVE